MAAIGSIEVRVLGNDHLYVSYSEGGRAKNAGFSSWQDFIEWLTQTVLVQNVTDASANTIHPVHPVLK